MWRWLSVGLVSGKALASLYAQAPEPDLPRPGSILMSEVTGEVTMINDDQRRRLKADERLRVGSTVVTGRKSMTALSLSNGTLLQLGPESELEVEEFGQAPVSGGTKFAELKAEPSISRTRLRLVRGEITVTVKPLQVKRGSSFILATVAGALRLSEGVVRAMVQMHDLGLGVCTIEVQNGAAEFQLLGSSNFASVPAGRKLAFAIEVDKAGVVKVGEMPKEKTDGKPVK